MSDAQWMYGQARERQEALHPNGAKRPRLSYDIPNGARAGFSPLFQNNGPMFQQMSPGFGEHLHIADPRPRQQMSPMFQQMQLPPNASPTVFVEGLPATTSRREVSHIFRPFLGYKAVRLVTKEPRHPGGESLVLCFVDFESPAHAATAIHALQGYKLDDHEPDLACLRLQFARHSGARVRGEHRGTQ